MPFIVYIVLALAVFAVSPYLVFVVRRLLFGLKLKAVCRRKGYTFTPLKCFWWLDTVGSGRLACRVETADTCYAIKIIGTVFGKRHLRFLDDTHVAVRSLLFETYTTAKAAGYTYTEKEPYRFAEVVTDKSVHPVILLHPTPTTISAKRSDTNGEKAATPYWVAPKTDAPKRDELLQNGDFTGEGYVYTAKTFLNTL